MVANGREYELDCLIFATGFEVGTSYTRRAGYDIVGRGGVTLSEHWSDGLRTLHGLTTHGFPNCFFLGFTQTAITISVPQALNEQARARGAHGHRSRARAVRTSLEPTLEGEAKLCGRSEAASRASARASTWSARPATTTAKAPSGNKGGFFSDMYGAGPLRFFEVLEEWRANGRMEGLELR